MTLRQVGDGVVVELSEQFRRRAAECFRWGQSALTLSARSAWLNMAQFWLQLAQTAELNDGGNETKGTSASASSNQPPSSD
jgi:hypothetical protein